MVTSVAIVVTLATQTQVLAAAIAALEALAVVVEASVAVAVVVAAVEAEVEALVSVVEDKQVISKVERLRITFCKTEKNEYDDEEVIFSSIRLGCDAGSCTGYIRERPLVG